MSEDDWDPTSLDIVISDDPNWYKAEPSPTLPDPMYDHDEYGEVRGRVLINQREWQVHYFDALDKKLSSDNDNFHNTLEQFADDPDSVIDLVVYHANREHYVCDHETVEAAPKIVMTSEPDYGQLRPHLGWLPIDAIKKMFEHTTQLARMPMSTILKKGYKSLNPALNVRHRDEPVATDTIYSDTPAIDCGVTSAQLFVGTKTHTADVYPIKFDKQFVNTLLDNITQRGAPTKLISDRAKVEISESVKQVLLPLQITTWQSELHQHHQNPAERQYQNIKRLCNTILDHSGAPAYTWLLCLMYVCFLLNNTWFEVVDDIPFHMSMGSTNDISSLLCFHFWEPVYYKLDDSDFLSDSCEKHGHFVGISESVGHAMTFKILTDDILRLSIDPMSDRLLTRMLRTFDLIHSSLVMLPCPLSSLVMTRQMMGRFYLRCMSLTPRNLSVIPSSWIRKTGNDIMHESSMLLMKRRFANILANTNVNSSGNLDTYNLFALSMMMTTKRSFPTMR
jgi:hypothetical protein